MPVYPLSRDLSITRHNFYYICIDLVQWSQNINLQHTCTCIVEAKEGLSQQRCIANTSKKCNFETLCYFTNLVKDEYMYKTINLRIPDGSVHMP